MKANKLPKKDFSFIFENNSFQSHESFQLTNDIRKLAHQVVEKIVTIRLKRQGKNDS